MKGMIPVKKFVSCVSLANTLAGGNRFLSPVDAEK